MTPKVGIGKTDGNLGVATDTDRILAIIAPASAGVMNTGVSVTTKTDLVEEFESGPLVLAGAYMLSLGIPIVAFRGSPTTDGAYGAINSTEKTGTSAVTAGTSKPTGTFDGTVEILHGGVVGVAGIVFRFSLDNELNWSQPQALGTATTLTCDSGVSFALSNGGDPAETLMEGDRWTFTTTAPKLLTGDLATSLDALSDYSGEWLRALILAEADATVLAQCDGAARSYHEDGKYPEFITNTRPRGVEEIRPTYQAALAAIAGEVQSLEVSCAVDQCEMVDDVTGRRLRVPQSIAYAARLMLNDDSVDAAEKGLGALPRVFLTTRHGERRYHDERRHRGLDVLGFTTMRTWGGRPVSPGAYINNPRLLSGPGSDYRYFQLSAIVNRVIETTYALLEPRLSRGVLCDPATGRIRGDVAASIEEVVNAELRSRYQDPGRVSGVRCALSRNDNVLSTDRITFEVGVQPLAYPKEFIGKAGLVRTIGTTT
ncbi:MAG: hypothetical protein KF764_08575 [Labilithrix sp.]|nr:hypothetical protein [Labilithrix sp.]